MTSSAERLFLEIVSGKRRGVGALFLRAGLWVLSWPYAAVTAVRNWAFDSGWKRSYRVNVPVVSIGNLTLGGTGKTPAVEYVARFFERQGRRVAILSRGYGSHAGANDEALVLNANLPKVPHLQGADRVALANKAIAERNCEILLLDDGFQHRRLQRSLNIVLVDATNPWGFGRVFPGGTLREPRNGLKRADLVLLTRCDQVPQETKQQIQAEVIRLAPGAPVVCSRHMPVRLVNAEREAPLSTVTGQPVFAFCGIGNPAAFRRTLDELGCKVTAFEVFPDHRSYTLDDINRLEALASRLPDNGLAITTQKDLVKIRLNQLGGRPLWAVAIALILTAGQEALDTQLNGVLA